MSSRRLLDRRARRARAQIARAAARRRAGDAPSAIDLLAEILATEPDDVAANAEMARALRLLGDPVGAEEHLRRALRGVLDYQLVVELAMALIEQSRAEEAEELIDAALAMAGGNPRLDPAEALLVRATLASAQGRQADALATLDSIHRKRASQGVLRYVDRLREDILKEAAAG